MVERFHADDALHKVDMPTLDIGHERRLGIAGTGDQHFANVGERLHNFVEHTMVVGHFSRPDLSRLPMYPTFRIVTVHFDQMARTEGEARDTRLPVVEPHDCVNF